MKYLFKVLLVMVFVQCTKLTEYDLQQVRRAMNDSLTTRTESWDFNVVMMQNGVRAFSITSPYGFSQETDSGAVTFVKGPVHVQVYDSTGIGIDRTVDCGALTYFARTSFLFMTGGVDIITHDSRNLRAAELRWQQQQHLLISDGFVTVVTPDDSLSGYGLRAKDDLSEYRIREVSGEVTVERNDENVP
jgi:hypothetical protein